MALDGVDVVGQIPEVLSSLEDRSYDIVFSNHFLEHVDDLARVLAECARLLKPGGRFIAVVPHFSNPYFYSDPTHKTPFGLYSMSYFALDGIHRRRVPRYVVDQQEVRYRLVNAELRFNRSLRQPVGYVVGRIFETLARSSRGFREFYERRLAWLFPCDEIRFELELP